MTSQEHQLVNVVGELGQRERDGPLVVTEARHAEALEVGANREAGEFVRGDRSAGEVVERLLLRDLEILADGLRFSDEHPGPEDVDPAAVPCRRAVRFVLEQRDALRNDPELPEQVGPEGLGVALFRVAAFLVVPLANLLDPPRGEAVELTVHNAAIHMRWCHEPTLEGFREAGLASTKTGTGSP